jgi:DNA-binding NarL/FixJ family response regulator
MEQRFADESSLIRVVVIANSVITRAGLEALLATSPMLELVGNTASTEILGQYSEPLQPDVVLMEWGDPENDPLPALLTPDSDVPAIVLLMDEWQQASISEALRSGVRGLLPIEATADEIVKTIQAAASGLTIIHPEFLDGLLAPATQPLPNQLDQPLTSREIEVLGMLAEGLGNKAIARRLTISEHTVKFHIGSIFSKLNASSRTEAVILGAKQGLILL